MSYRLVLDETIDVDAITLSLARMSHDDLIMPVAVTGIVIAAAVNSLVKGGHGNGRGRAKDRAVGLDCRCWALPLAGW